MAEATPLDFQAEVRPALEAARRATRARLAALDADFEAIVASADSNADDEHDPDGSTIAFERAQVAALRAEARAQLVDLDQAEVRRAAGRHATCEGCGGPIAPERLVARPATQVCIACATLRPSS